MSCPRCGIEDVSMDQCIKSGYIRNESGRIIKEKITCWNCGTEFEQPFERMI